MLQDTVDISQHCTLETYMMSLTNVTSITLIKKKKGKREKKNLPAFRTITN